MPQTLSSFVPDQQSGLKTFVPDSGASAPPSYNMAESGMLGAISGATMGIAPWAGGLYYGFPGTEAYKKGVQTEQARYSEAAKQNPISYSLGAIGSSLPGLAATAAPGVVANGVTMLSRATPAFLKGTEIATGAGALQGVTSTPIGSDASTYMANAGAGAVVGAAGGAVLGAAAKLPYSSVGPALTNVIHPAKAVSAGKIASEAIQQANQIRHNAIVTANVDNLPNNQLTPAVIQRANDIVDAQLGRPGQKKAPAALTPLSVDGGKTFVNPEDPNYTKIASMLNMPTEVTTNPRYSVEDIVPKVLNKWAGDYKNSGTIPQTFTAPTPTSTLSNAIVGQVPGAVAAGVTSMAASHLGMPPVVSGVVADLAGHGSYLIGKPVYDKWRTNQMTDAFTSNLNSLQNRFKSDPTSLTDTISNYETAKAANNNVHPTDIPVGTQQAPTAADYVNPNDTPNVAPGQGGGFGGWRKSVPMVPPKAGSARDLFDRANSEYQAALVSGNKETIAAAKSNLTTARNVVADSVLPKTDITSQAIQAATEPTSIGQKYTQALGDYNAALAQGADPVSLSMMKQRIMSLQNQTQDLIGNMNTPFNASSPKGQYEINRKMYDNLVSKERQGFKLLPDELMMKNYINETLKQQQYGLTDLLMNGPSKNTGAGIPQNHDGSLTLFDETPVNPNAGKFGQGGGIGGWTPNNPQTMSDMGYGLNIVPAGGRDQLNFMSTLPQPEQSVPSALGNDLNFTNGLTTPLVVAQPPATQPQMSFGNVLGNATSALTPEQAAMLGQAKRVGNQSFLNNESLHALPTPTVNLEQMATKAVIQMKSQGLPDAATVSQTANLLSSHMPYNDAFSLANQKLAEVTSKPITSVPAPSLDYTQSSNPLEQWHTSDTSGDVVPTALPELTGDNTGSRLAALSNSMSDSSKTKNWGYRAVGQNFWQNNPAPGPTGWNSLSDVSPQTAISNYLQMGDVRGYTSGMPLGTPVTSDGVPISPYAHGYPAYDIPSDTQYIGQ